VGTCGNPQFTGVVSRGMLKMPPGKARWVPSTLGGEAMFRKVLWTVVTIAVIALLTVPMARAAIVNWVNTRGYADAPGQGEFLWNNNPGEIVWGPNILIWDQGEIDALKALWYNPVVELEGADPTDPSTCDQLEADWVFVDFPNLGWSRAQTCGGFWTRKEQFDIVVKRKGNFVPGHHYTALGFYDKVSGAPGNGEVNFSYEHLWNDSWMGKVRYQNWNPICSDPPNSQPGAGPCPQTLFIIPRVAVVKTQFTNPGSKIVNRGLYSYYVKRQEDGSLKVRVEVDFQENLQEYKVAAHSRAEMLLKENRATPLPVTITFVRPLLWSEISALRKETGLYVEGYTFVATYEDGRKAMIGGVADETGLIALEQLREIVGQQDVTLRGIMVVQGYLEPRGLWQLLNDERVFLVDTVAAEIISELQTDEAYRNAPHISVFVPSPYWDLWN